MKKRSFKIATAFVGVAAATMGVGPAALAATALPASRTGSIRNQLCSTIGNGGSHWVHLYYPRGPHNVPIHDPECFGFKGTTTAGAVLWSACPGNNAGTLFFSDASNLTLFPGGGLTPLNFIMGTAHQTSATLIKVRLTGWKGTGNCPSINLTLPEADAVPRVAWPGLEPVAVS